MKIRTGFVSNSSSSSFLVAFPRNPKSVEDIQEMVFCDEEWFAHPYAGDPYPPGYTAEHIAKYIWDGAKNQIPNNRKMIMSHMHSVLVDNIHDFYIQEAGKKDWECDLDYEAWDLANQKAVEDFMEKHKDAFFYHFEYHDNGAPSEECAMEHGDLFKNLPHLVASHH